MSITTFIVTEERRRKSLVFISAAIPPLYHGGTSRYFKVATGTRYLTEIAVSQK